jgi:uncharacterized protein
MKRMLLYITVFILLILFIAGCGIYKNQEKMIFYPQYLDRNYQYVFTQKFEELFIKSGDGEINALHFKTDSSKGVILFFHGNAGALNSWGELGEQLTKGYDLFIFDYKGFGKSTGAQSEYIFHEDSKVLYEYLKQSYPENNIILYGRSLGTGFATKLASEANPKMLILETPYYSFKSLAKHYFPYLPVSLILKWKIKTNEWIQQVKCPIAIFHGTEDEVIPYQQSVRLKKLLKSSDTLVTVKNASHNNISMFPEYNEGIKKLLE